MSRDKDAMSIADLRRNLAGFEDGLRRSRDAAAQADSPANAVAEAVYKSTLSELYFWTNGEFGETASVAETPGEVQP